MLLGWTTTHTESIYTFGNERIVVSSRLCMYGIISPEHSAAGLCAHVDNSILCDVSALP